MLGIYEYSQSLFYMEYSIYIPVLVLWIMGCPFFRNCIWDVTHNKSFGLGWTAINEVRKRIVYMTYDIIVFFLLWMYNVVVYGV